MNQRQLLLERVRRATQLQHATLLPPQCLSEYSLTHINITSSAMPHRLPYVRQFTLVLLAASSLMTSGVAAAAEQIPAVFKLREVHFVYRSVANLFACDELRRAVAVILRAMGARDDVQVRVNDCELVLLPDERASNWDRWNPENPPDRFRNFDEDHRQFSTVYIKVMFPIEATPEVMKEIDKDKSRRDLISRVTGESAAALDPIVFPAEHREVTLSRSTLRLRPEHCELLEQMIPSLARQLNFKVINKQLSCDRYGRGDFAPKITVEVLWPTGAPVPGEKK
jgi:hypothetical protein